MFWGRPQYLPPSPRKVTSSPQNRPLEPPVGVAPEGASPTPGRLSPRRLRLLSPRVFSREGEGEEVLTAGCKTPSLYTSLDVVSGPDCPDMDIRRVPDTLPHSTSASLIFTHIVEAIASFLRQKHCLHVHVYLNDWLFRHQSRDPS